ncbi:MAG: MFS transporter [Dehalococcoidia bacterium]|nr:MFS transporter [Dehalococcoidia bacterium]MDW8120575.1 MFS transporter [Chloroflexota bacterium]
MRTVRQDGQTPSPWRARRFPVRTFASLAIRDYRYLWLGLVSTSLGLWMDQVARGWLMYSLTRSALDLGLVMAVRGLPTLIFGVVAGVVADRYGRKAQLLLSQGTNCLLNLVLALLVATQRIQPWHVYLTGFLAGTVQAFQQPARQSLLSDLVGRENLMNAIGLNSAAFNLARSVGPALAGVVIALVGVAGSYVLQAGLYAVATVWTVQMRVPQEREEARQRASRQASFLGNLGEVFAYLWTHRLILALVLLGVVPLMLGMPFTSLLPVFAVDILGVGASGQGLMLAGVGVGALVGAIGVASLGEGQARGVYLLGASALLGVSLVLFSLSPWLAMAVGMAFLTGLFRTVYTTQTQTALQMLAPDHLRGRIMSIYLLDRGLVPIGSILAGALAHAWGAPTAVALMGGAVVVCTLAIALAVPSVRTVNLRARG